MATSLNPALSDVWKQARLLEATYGFALGLMQVTYHVFLYEHFGANATALKITVALYISMNLSTFLLEIPTGAIGDYFGRKRTIISCFVVAAFVYFLRSWIYFIESISLSIFIATIAALFYSLSYCLYSGSLTAWIVDSVRECGVPEGHGPILARAYGAMLTAKIIGAVIGVWCFLSGMVFLAFGIGSIAALLCSLYCGATMQETKSLTFHRGSPFVRETLQRMYDIIRIGWQVCLRHPPVRYMILMFVGFMLVVHMVNALWPIALRANFEVTHMTLYWYLITFGGMLAAFGGARFLSQILSRAHMHATDQNSAKRLWNWFALVSLVMAGSVLCFGTMKLRDGLTPQIFLVLFIGFNMGYGFLMPASETLLNLAVPTINARERATINSIGPMLVDAVIVLLAFPSSGSNGETIVVGWMLPASLLIITTTVIHFAMRRHFRKEAENVILGGYAAETATSPH